MRILVVDDERLARVRLVRILDQLGHTDVHQAADGLDAVRAVPKLDPDVVLLDIRMPGLDGLEAARTIGDRAAVVFTTAYDEHALTAFELDAVDYLVKPIRKDRLAQALHRARRRDRDWLEAVVRNATGAEQPRLAVRQRDRWIVVDPLRVTRFRAADKLVAFRWEGAELWLDQSLNALERSLGRHGFLRIHRSELVRVDAISGLEADAAGWVVRLRDGQEARVSRRALAALKERLGIVS